MNDEYLNEIALVNVDSNSSSLQLKRTIDQLTSNGNINIQSTKSIDEWKVHIFNSLKNQDLNQTDIKKLTSIILRSLKKNQCEVLKEQDTNFNSNRSNILTFSENISSLSSDSKYDADLSGNCMSKFNSESCTDDETRENQKCFFNDFNKPTHKGYLCNYGRYLSGLNDCIEKETSNKTSSSGVYTESMVHSWDNQSESNSFGMIRVIEDSYNSSSTSSITSSVDNIHETTDDFINFRNDCMTSSEYCPSVKHDFSHTNVEQSTMLDDSINKSSYNWLQSDISTCYCEECYYDKLGSVTDISVVSISNHSFQSSCRRFDDSFPLSAPRRRVEANNASSSIMCPCDLENPCLYCIKKTIKLRKRFKSTR